MHNFSFDQENQFIIYIQKLRLQKVTISQRSNNIPPVI